LNGFTFPVGAAVGLFIWCQAGAKFPGLWTRRRRPGRVKWKVPVRKCSQDKEGAWGVEFSARCRESRTRPMQESWRRDLVPDVHRLRPVPSRGQAFKSCDVL